jgi:hypothetical protein
MENTWNTIIVAATSYVLGVATGYYGCSLVKGGKIYVDGVKFDYRNVVILVVSIGWLASVLVSVANPAFKVDIALHGLMGAIVGYFFKQKQNE